MSRLALRGLAARKLRTSLTIVAVLLGVTMIAGTFVLTDTIQKAFDDIFSAQTKGADVVVSAQSLREDGTTATFETPSGAFEITSPMVGDYNLANIAIAVGMAVAIDLPPDAIVAGLASVAGVPGRLERVKNARDVLCVVDYAHTPDALERAIAALRPLARGRLIVVFGCGGDRDPGKRAKMGAAVAEGADLAIVTTDNPRSEDPRAIVDAVLSGMVAAGRFVPEVDLHRATAIGRAIARAAEGDVVLIAGKGHETYQEVRGVRHPFDDRVEARRALAHRRAKRGGK